MPTIKQLPPHEAQKIAAGEVIERPANIIKELIENSVDAGATQIKIMLRDGGKELIRIIDNGCGMDEDDARLCFNKHATSKIETVDQVENVQTFGFRGEALASVAAVAKVTLVTKHRTMPHATKVMVEQNRIISQEMVAAPQGTDLSVADLFYAIPARKKFLKKKESEWRQVVQLFQAFCLDYPAIHFQLSSEDKMIYNCPAVTQPIDRITQLWDHAIGGQMMTVEHHHGAYGINLSGVISHHEYHRYDRSGIFFFVNKRWVKNQTLSSALMKGYQQVLPPGKYPLVALALTLESHDVDINIHPRKEEVKFMNPRIVEQLIQDGARMALERYLSSKINIPVRFAPYVPPTVSKTASEQRLQQAAPFFTHALQEYPQQKIEHSVKDTPLMLFGASSNALHEQPFKESSDYEQIADNSTMPAPQFHQIIGQFQKTYIIIEKEEGLFFVDQHAAHERILYESFKERFKQATHVNLLFPHLITLSAADKALIDPHLGLLIENNILVESFGAHQLRIVATPVHLQSVPMEDLVRQIIGWLRDDLSSLANHECIMRIHEKIHAQMACKAAVKAGDVLTMEQMQKLLRDLDGTRSNFCCPHGRPTGWLLSLGEIEKKFKRDYKGGTIF